MTTKSTGAPRASLVHPGNKTFERHASKEAIWAALEVWRKKKVEADQALLWLRDLLAKRATQELRGEWPAPRDVEP